MLKRHSRVTECEKAPERLKRKHSIDKLEISPLTESFFFSNFVYFIHQVKFNLKQDNKFASTCYIFLLNEPKGEPAILARLSVAGVSYSWIFNILRDRCGYSEKRK